MKVGSVENIAVELSILSLGTVEVYDQEEGFFAQGEHAWEIILEIHHLWVNGDMTTQQAFQQWISQNM